MGTKSSDKTLAESVAPDPVARDIADRIRAWCRWSDDDQRGHARLRKYDYSRLSRALLDKANLAIKPEAIRRRLERGSPLTPTFLDACAKAMGISISQLFTANSAQPPLRMWQTPLKVKLEDYADTLFHQQSAARRSGITLVYGHHPTLRILPLYLYSRLYDRLFDPFGDLGKELKQQLDSLKQRFEAAYATLKPRDFPRVDNLMLTNDWEKLLQRRWPYDRLSAQMVLDFVKHLREDWIEKRHFRLFLIDERRLKRKSKAALILEAWETIAVVSQNLAIKRALDFSLIFSEDRVTVHETFGLLEKIRDRLAHPADMQFYEHWATVECEREARRYSSAGREPSSSQ